MAIQELAATARAMVAKGKGILAIDESLPTIKKRFDSIGVESTKENRRAYRELLIDNSGDSDYISGMILFDETIRQKSATGQPFPDILAEKGIMPGIKVDAGAKDLAGHTDEKVTEGLDGLRDRLGEYKSLGAKFAKWRAVITIGSKIPSTACIEANAHALARYASLCQEAGIVPMVEPEVLMDSDNTIERCFEVTEITLHTVFNELIRQDVALEYTILKTNMVLAGKQCPVQASVEAVADKTLLCLKRVVPAAVPGIVFLSGGQGGTEATRHLNAMNKTGLNLPWPLSFSYGRALQTDAINSWGGNPRNVEQARDILLHRERCNGLAAMGQYSDTIEGEIAA